MLETLTRESFSALVGSIFLVRAEGTLDEPLPLTLLEARQLGDQGRTANREPFSLHFRGPAAIGLPQHTYELESEHFPEPLGIFIVPIARDAQGITYEAIFT